MAPAGLDGRHGCVDKFGKWIIPPRFADRIGFVGENCWGLHIPRFSDD